jgi:hypothetical protein
MTGEMPTETPARTAAGGRPGENPTARPEPAAGSALDRLTSPITAVVLTFLVFLVSAVALVVRWRDDFTPVGDLAIAELTVREVGRHAVLLGPYSRFRWWHPGPMLWYLLALPYRLLGGRSIGTSVGSALISGIGATGVVLAAARVGGRRLAWWSALVVGLFVWSMGPELLRYPWNPYVTVLPVALFVMLAWAAACGEAWAIPAGLGTGTFLVQSHIGYGPMVAAITVTAAAVLGVRRWRGDLELPWPRLRRAGVVSVILLVLLWAPPLVEQVMHDPGNGREVLRFFREHTPDHTLGDGTSTTYRGLGTVVEQLVAHRTGYGVSRAMPAWTDITTLVALAVALVVALRRRLHDALVLLGLTAVLGAVSVWSVSRIIGTVEPYLVQWIAVLSPIAWIAVGAVATRAVPARDQLGTDRARTLVQAAGAVVVAGAVLLTGINAWSSVQALPPDAQISPSARRFMDAVVAAIPRDSREPVLVKIGDQQAWPWAASAVLELEKAGIPVRVDREHGWLISGRLGTDSDDFDRQVLLTLSGEPGSAAARRDPRQTLVARGSGVEAFLSDRRAGR